MADFIVQFLSLAIFISGLMIGEVIAHRAFGRPKSPIIFIVDVALIVFIISAVYTFVGFSSPGPILYATNFMVGLVTIMIARSVEWGLGMTQKSGLSGSKTIDVIRLLAHYGLDMDEIKAALKQFGMPHKGVEKYSHLIESTVPSYVPKLVKMERTLDSIDARVRGIEESMNNGRRNGASAQSKAQPENAAA